MPPSNASSPAAPPSIISGRRVLTLKDLGQRGAQGAALLKDLGVGENDVVALFLRNDFEFFEAALATSAVGAYATPINWHASADELAYILQDSGAKILLAHADLVALLGAAFQPTIPVLFVETPSEIGEAYGVAPGLWKAPAGSPVWSRLIAPRAPLLSPAPASRSAIIYTSGTTGRPKGVRRAPGGAGMLETTVAGYGLGGEMTVLMNGPMYHAAPNGYASIALAMGANIILQPRFEPEELLALIAAHRATHMHIVPTMFHRLLKLSRDIRNKYDLSSLVDVVHGAAPCPIDTKQAMIAWWGAVISEYYGSSETGLITRITAGQALERPGSVGQPLPNVEIAILDDNGAALPVGETGEVFIKNTSMPSFTYHGAPEKRAEIERQGFVTVGDVGRLDPDGFLYLLDRKRDMIISGGVNIYSAEVEAALAGVPGVRDCAVFGAPHEEFGEQVVAYIERDPDHIRLTEAEVICGLDGRIARFKFPRIIKFSDALPREDSGKIFKRKLREPYWVNAGRLI